MKRQLERLQKSFEFLVTSVHEELQKVLDDLEMCQTVDNFDRHFTPMDMQKLNFIERKFVINHLSYDSVAKQY